MFFLFIPIIYSNKMLHIIYVNSHISKICLLDKYDNLPRVFNTFRPSTFPNLAYSKNYSVDLMNTALNTLRKKAMWFVKCDELESNQGDLHRLYSDVVDRLDIDLTFYVTQISMMK